MELARLDPSFQSSLVVTSVFSSTTSRNYRVITQSMEEWIRNPRKFRSSGSISWNTMMDVYPFIGDWLCWQIGNGRKVRIGEDP
jgi:hypothetical protein